jgi:hypothetical protein
MVPAITVPAMLPARFEVSEPRLAGRSVDPARGSPPARIVYEGGGEIFFKKNLRRRKEKKKI